MVIIAHNNGITTRLLNADLEELNSEFSQQELKKSIPQIAKLFPDNLIIWCHCNLIDSLNIKELERIFNHKRVLATYNPTLVAYLSEKIGYVDRSYFIKINKAVRYPTWLMSSWVGGTYSEVINLISDEFNSKNSLDYILCSIAKRGMPKGLFCYSEPNLLKDFNTEISSGKTASSYELFEFVKQNYKWVWSIYLALCFAIYERKFKILPLIRSLFKKRYTFNYQLDKIESKSKITAIKDKSVDVIIPTLGRKEHLLNVLNDLAEQTLTPKRIIIVEQHPDKSAVSELDYLKNKVWPFAIKHEFTHKLGVCNARNTALRNVDSEWVFFADDDIRIDSNFIDNVFNEITETGFQAVNFSCLQTHQKESTVHNHQTFVFASGSSLVKTSALNDLKFDLAFENGFGEDSDFGMQLRNKGYDVIFLPNLKILHLKVPSGGFRTKISKPWDYDDVSPKPSPTIMLLYQRYFSKYQIRGYKLLLFIELIRNSNFKNPLKLKKKFLNQWQRSVHWSNILEH